MINVFQSRKIIKKRNILSKRNKHKSIIQSTKSTIKNNFILIKRENSLNVMKNLYLNHSNSHFKPLHSASLSIKKHKWELIMNILKINKTSTNCIKKSKNQATNLKRNLLLPCRTAQMTLLILERISYYHKRYSTLIKKWKDKDL